MKIHPALYDTFKNIENMESTEIERFYSKIKAIEATDSVLGTICVPEIIGNLREDEEDIDKTIIEYLKKIEKQKYLRDFLILSKEWPPFSFYVTKILSISEAYKKDIAEAPKGYISKKILLNLIRFFLEPFSDIYRREVFKKDIDRCKVSIESESSQNFVWCDILIQAKNGFYKNKEVNQIKADIESTIRFHNAKKESRISPRKVDKYYNLMIRYICEVCCISMEYDRRHGISEKDIQDYFIHNFPFRKIVYDRFCRKNTLSKEKLDECVSYEEFYRTHKSDDDAEYVYGGVFIPQKELK